MIVQYIDQFIKDNDFNKLIDKLKDSDWTYSYSPNVLILQKDTVVNSCKLIINNKIRIEFFHRNTLKNNSYYKTDAFLMINTIDYELWPSIRKYVQLI